MLSMSTFQIHSFPKVRVSLYSGQCDTDDRDSSDKRQQRACQKVLSAMHLKNVLQQLFLLLPSVI